MHIVRIIRGESIELAAMVTTRSNSRCEGDGLVRMRSGENDCSMALSSPR